MNRAFINYLKHMKVNLLVVLTGLLFFLVSLSSVEASVRIKEIAQFDGARDNQLIGYGIVVGLNGTGDKGKSVFTVRSIASLLQRLGLKIDSREISVKNAAAVMITATLPPFVKNGTRIDVTLSSLGDAKSLAGGILLQTPLQGPDGTVYAVAQGAVSAEGAAGDAKGNLSTVVRIPNGALIEREVPVTMLKDGVLSLLLHKNDFTTATRMAEAINLDFGEVIAYAPDAGTVSIRVPELFQNDLVKFVSKIERLQITPDYRAKIIINERTGTIVGGKDARISKISLAHKNINIEIEPQKKEERVLEVSQQAQSLSHYSEAFFKEDEASVQAEAPGEISVGELAQCLSSLGVGSRDLISILQSMKAADAIQAEIVVV